MVGIDDGEVLLNPLFTFQEEGELFGKITGRLKQVGHGLVYTDKLQMAGFQSTDLRRGGDSIDNQSKGEG
ncbi:hypothetical protein D3C76_20050 [compost metagenome]